MGNSEPRPPLPDISVESLARIRDDRTHGASWLAREAARALADMTEPGPEAAATARLAQARHAAREFARVRPSMAAIANSVARIWASPTSADDPPTRLATLHAAALTVAASWDTGADAIGHYALPLLRTPLFTHSHSGTVERVLLRLVQVRHHTDGALSIYVTESRPGGEGIALSRALANAGWDVTLVADAACGVFVQDAGSVVVGADSVRADGSLVNKVGTYPLALAAQAAGRPFYVLCESLKIAAPDYPLVFEAMDPGELLSEPMPGVTARNPYFERTPASLVTGVVTELGVLDTGQIGQCAAAAALALAALLGS